LPYYVTSVLTMWPTMAADLKYSDVLHLSTVTYSKRAMTLQYITLTFS